MEIIFIYNANSGFFSGMMDSAHKLFSPDTYTCDLCSITHGLAGPKREWQEFIDGLEHPIKFYHKNDLPPAYENLPLPVILKKSKENFEILVSKDEMSEMKTVTLLTDMLNNKLKNRDKAL
ncbi:MAG: hypothetical protein ACI8XB_003056 [Patiriisocius sp.]|jgi:hypothetical protein